MSKQATAGSAVAKTAAPVNGVSAPGTTDTKAGAGTALTAPVPVDFAAMLLDDSQKLKAQFSTEDLAIPFLRVLQGLSPEVTKGSEKFIDAARPSMFLNTVSREVYDGDEGVIVIPVVFTPSFTEWWPRDSKQGNGIVKDWKTDASNMTRCKRDDRGKDVTPEGTQMVRAGMYYILLVDPKTGATKQLVLTLSGTQLKKVKRWNSIIRELSIVVPGTEDMEGGPKMFTPAPFYMSYKMITVPEKNDKGSWFGVSISSFQPTIQLPNGIETYKLAREFAQAAIAGTVKVASVADEIVDAEIVDNKTGAPRERQPGEEDDAF